MTEWHHLQEDGIPTPQQSSDVVSSSRVGSAGTITTTEETTTTVQTQQTTTVQAGETVQETSQITTPQTTQETSTVTETVATQEEVTTEVAVVSTEVQTSQQLVETTTATTDTLVVTDSQDVTKRICTGSGVSFAFLLLFLPLLAYLFLKPVTNAVMNTFFPKPEAARPTAPSLVEMHANPAYGMEVDDDDPEAFPGQKKKKGANAGGVKGKLAKARHKKKKRTSWFSAAPKSDDENRPRGPSALDFSEGVEAGGNQTARCLQDACSLCAAWSERVPEHLGEILAKFEAGVAASVRRTIHPPASPWVFDGRSVPAATSSPRAFDGRSIRGRRGRPTDAVRPAAATRGKSRRRGAAPAGRRPTP